MTAQELKNARLENLAAYMAADSEADRVNIELVYSAAYAYLTGGVAPDPMTLPGAPEELTPGLWDLALNSLALHWYDHRGDMEAEQFPPALRPILTQLKAKGGELVG